jgi:orc1/cdc6 family replication initiation protein
MFIAIHNRRMIENARVLRDEFIPSEVKHRDATVNHLSAALNPIIEGKPAETVFLFGPSGTGKTCIAQFTVKRLREEALGVNTQYVNCWEDYSRFKTLYTILDGIDKTLDIHRQSTPRDVLLDRLRDYEGPPYVVILDEVDQLEDKGLLYELYRTKNLELILIANREEDVFATLDDRLNSRLSSCTRIRFDPYSMDELLGILEDRVRWGLAPDAITSAGLELIANEAVGDARKAIGILRAAAKAAQHGGEAMITEDVIQDAIPQATSEIRQRSLEKLNPDQRVLYEVIVDAETIAPGKLYEEYVERTDDPKTQRTMRTYLAKMQHYNLISAEGSTRNRVYTPL